MKSVKKRCPMVSAILISRHKVLTSLLIHKALTSLTIKLINNKQQFHFFDRIWVNRKHGEKGIEYFNLKDTKISTNGWQSDYWKCGRFFSKLYVRPDTRLIFGIANWKIITTAFSLIIKKDTFCGCSVANNFIRIILTYNLVCHIVRRNLLVWYIFISVNC